VLDGVATNLIMKILNLYSGIGGNRKLWKNVNVTSVEMKPQIAKVYEELFPNDTVIIGDAHEYLIEHYTNFDFIWSSPPCQSHSNARRLTYRNGTKKIYPDMKLWQEIIFLQHHAKCKWVVENINPYYKELITARKRGRHLFWSNFYIRDIDFGDDRKNLIDMNIRDLCKYHDFDVMNYKLDKKRQIMRNCIYPPLGLHVLNEAIDKRELEQVCQLQLAI